MEDSTPKPTIDVFNIHYKPSLAASRKRSQKNLLGQHSKENRVKTSYVVYKYRKKQRSLLDHDDIEDPDPYDESYVFYCFHGALEK